MGTTAAGANAPWAALGAFWEKAELPKERWPYLEFQARRYGHVGRLLASLGPLADRRVLDLGGGVGSLAVYLKAGVGGAYDLADFFEPSPVHRAALTAAGVEGAYRCDLSGADPLAGVPTGYDVILLVEVLEHLLVNPLLLFRAIWDHLAPDGVLLYTTPNQARLGNRWKLLRGRSIKEARRYPRDGTGTYGHVLEYERSELDKLLREESFLPVATDVVQQVPSTSPTRFQRWGVRWLNGRLARRWALGDDLLGLYRKAPRPTFSEAERARRALEWV